MPVAHGGEVWKLLDMLNLHPVLKSLYEDRIGERFPNILSAHCSQCLRNFFMIPPYKKKY